MRKLYKMTSHNLSDAQKTDATQNLGVVSIKSLPTTLQQKFSQVSPFGDLDETFLLDIQTEIHDNLNEGDFVLIQGEFGVTFHIVSFCIKNGYIPIYATTKRDSNEVVQLDGSTKKVMVFNHIQFREYK